MYDPYQDHEVHPSLAHPLARELLDADWFWSLRDDYGPIGSDDGADAFSDIRNELSMHPTEDPIRRFEEYVRWSGFEFSACEPWPTDHDYDDVAAYHYDTVAIAFAIGQFMMQGRVGTKIGAVALRAIDRQLHPVPLDEFQDPEIRRERLLAMKEVLSGVVAADPTSRSSGP